MTINEALMDFAQFFVMEGDTMRCRDCSRGCVASRSSEEFRHAVGCRNTNLGWRPWEMLRAILSEEAAK